MAALSCWPLYIRNINIVAIGTLILLLLKRVLHRLLSDDRSTVNARGRGQCISYCILQQEEDLYTYAALVLCV